MTQRDESDFLKPSGERLNGNVVRRADPCEGMAAPSPPGDDSASRARAWWKVVAADLIAVAAITVVVVTLRWPPAMLLGLPVGILTARRWGPR